MYIPMSNGSPTASPRSVSDRLRSTLPKSIPLPRIADDRVLSREIMLLLFCAALTAAVYLIWSLVEEWLPGVPGERPAQITRFKDLLAPFITAYAAARLYTAMTRRYERQLERHRHLLAHILDTSADAIVTLDDKDRISTWNRGAAQIFGYSEEEILGRNAAMLIPEGIDAEQELKQLRNAIEKAEVLRAYDALRLTRDGKEIHVEVSTTVLRDGKGRYAGRASIVRDVTERDRIRRELTKKESLAVIGEMAAAIAHEIKNPLAGIGGAVQVIGRSFQKDDERMEVIGEIQHQVRRLDEAIRGLLTFARPTAPSFRRIDAAVFTNHILRVLGEEPDLKRHQIDVNVPDEVFLWADPQLLENILLNLLLNAGQALGERKGTITLAAEVHGNWVHLSVKDDGPGIPEETYPNIFKPFFTTKHRGTGLGLTIVNKLVEEIGGRMDVKTAKDRGTTFTVILPREQP